MNGGVESEPVLELPDGACVVGHGDLHPVLADAGLEVLRRVDRHDLPVVDDGDAVAVLRLVHVVRGEENGDVLALLEVVDVLPDGRPGLRVESHGRLVEEQHAGRVQQSAGDLQPALHAARVGGHLGLPAVPQVHHVEYELHPGVQLGPWHAVQVGVEAQVLLAGEVAVERRVLEHQADVAPYRVPLPDHVMPGHPRAPRGGVREGAQDLDRGRLARAVGPEEAEGLPRLDLEADAADGFDLSVALDQAGDLDGGLRHWPYPPPGRPS